jgi:hypothetical protein
MSLLPIFLLFFLLHCFNQHSTLVFSLNLLASRIGILISPFNYKNLISIQILILHALFSKLSHASVSKFNKSISFIWQNINIFNLSPHRKMSKKNLIHLSYSIVIVRDSKITNINGPCLLSK